MPHSIVPHIRGAALVLAIAASQIAPAAAATPPDAARPPSAGLSGHRLQQVALTTRDLPRSVAFYRDTLGLPLLFESNGMAFFDVAGMRLMIALDPRRTAPATPASVLYFDAPAFDIVLARLIVLGVAFTGEVEIVQSSPAGDLKLRQFTDPDGNALAIMGLVPRL